ncbi:unnamed protein product [Microthlaspi erraticum]|uniref:F-box protein At3g26010-like beta-propeller domain-containing protein n=1 Tax=Microthlaspi erraticum TaxID=1685480 RepID=A0A6D2KU31_9BRAS|nr:unnamed protein product [Microthlaspi erraticum]
MANPVSRQCVDIRPHVPLEKRFWILGIATRSVDEVVLSYKVVLLKNFTFLIYSSETGLWSLEAAHFPFSYISQEFNNPISLNGNLHWLADNQEHQDFLVSFDFYATGSQRCRAMPFPDLDKVPKFRRACTTSQGSLMYMNVVPVTNIDGSLENKICVWRLKNEGWQLVSEISSGFIKTGFSYIPLGSFDAKTVYFWEGNARGQRFLSINLDNGNIVIHKELERSSDGRILSSVGCPRDLDYILEAHFSSYFLPRWLYPFPNTVIRV